MTHRALPCLVTALALAACASEPSASTDEDPGDTSAGVLPVTPATPAALVATKFGTNTLLKQWQAGDVSFFQFASITATITNTGGTASNPIRTALAGANANEFMILADQSNCEGVALAPAAQCQLTLAFFPVGTTPGMRVAQVNIFGAPTLLQIGMHGNAVAPYTSLTTNTTLIDIGGVDLDDRGYGNVVVSNTGTGTVSLSRPTVNPGPFAVAGFDCSDTIAPGASCTVTVELHPSKVGTVTNQLTINSGANILRVDLRGVGTRLLTVDWTGNGQITAIPNLLTCSGTTCTGHFPGDIAVIATPAAGSTFTGWSPICGVNPTCALPADDNPNPALMATFSP